MTPAGPDPHALEAVRPIEATRALETELEADAHARSTLEAAMKTREPRALAEALAVMTERGLDCDDVLVDNANTLLAELQGKA